LAEETLSAVQLEEIGQRALTFQRYIFRRAWGAYYAVWAAAFVLFIFGGQLPLGNLFPQNLAWVPYVALFAGTGWAASLATASVFNSAHRAVFLRRAMGSMRGWGGREWALMWMWFVAFTALAFVSFAFFQPQAPVIIYGLLSSVEIFIYYSLRISFGEKLPSEGLLALVSYGACITLSIVASLLAGGLAYTGAIWGAETIVWVYCSLFALWHAPGELTDLRL
jgi:hypothetical protein